MKITRFAIAVLAVSMIGACSKPDNTSHPAPTYTTYSSMNTVYDMLRAQPMYTTINSTTGGSFYSASGTRYVFDPACFMDGTGGPVTGNVQIAVTEYLKKGDMIFSKMLPVSNNEPLLSGGEVSVYATQGGKELFLRPGYYYQAIIPQGGTPMPGMTYFAGNPAQDTAVNKVNWNNKIDSTGGHGAFGMVVYQGDSLDIISDSLHECNADQFMTSPDYQNFNVTIAVTGAVLGSNHVFGYTLYDTYKGVWPLGEIGSYSNGVFNEMHVPNIPVHFAVFTLINNRFYGGVTAATPASGSNYNVTLTEVDPVAFKGQLNNLVK